MATRRQDRGLKLYDRLPYEIGELLRTMRDWDAAFEAGEHSVADDLLEHARKCVAQLREWERRQIRIQDSQVVPASPPPATKRSHLRLVHSPPKD